MTSLVLPSIPALDDSARKEAEARLDRLTKPPGSLGRLEQIAARLAAVQAAPRPRIQRRLAVVIAADHGVAARGVSAYPPEVTAQMVRNFLAGGAAINVLARAAGAEVMVVDAGIREPIGDARALDLRLGPGTADFSLGPAMDRGTAEEALRRGIELGLDGVTADAVACGEMGIGNTTAATAVAAALLGVPARSLVGPGTGLDAGGLARKAEVLEQALALHRPDPADPIGVLSKVGGFEIGTMAGLMIGCAAARRAVVLDGLISASAALLATRLAPEARGYMFASHLSPEPAHRWLLAELGLEPMLDLGMRLGEGTGAVLAIPLLDAACRILDEMATFDEAGVSGSETAGPGVE